MAFNSDQRRLFHALLYPSLFVLLLCLIKVSEYLFEFDLHTFGVYPREINSFFSGILLMPLIHGDWQHLFSNSIALLVLGFLLIYFYRPLHFKIFWIIYFVSGLITWLIGRPSYHIGASGIIYGLVAFLFVSGILRKHIGLMAVSAITVLSYGSIVWGIFPFAVQHSWEGHFGGFLAGFVLAFVYRNKGPQKPVFVWKEDPEHEHNEWQITEFEQTQASETSHDYTEADPLKINYVYKPKSEPDKQ